VTNCSAPSPDCFVCEKHALSDAAEGGVIWCDDLVYAGHCHLLGREDIHLHVHLMPRYPATPREYWQQRVVEWPDGPRGGLEAMQAVTKRIRAALAQPEA
jgi:hypothetical protein